MWHFEDQYAMKEAREELNSRREDVGHMVLIHRETKDGPERELLMLWCCAFEVMRLVQAKSIVTCEGCVKDRKSQMDHLDGCMLSPYTKLQQYGEESRASVCPDLIRAMYNCFLQKLNIPIGHPAYFFAISKMFDVLRSDVDDFFDKLTNSEATFPANPRYIVEDVYHKASSSKVVVSPNLG